MVTCFFDSSAIVAAYSGQANSERARELLGSSAVVVSRLAEVETISALARLARERSTPDVRRDAVISAFLTDLETWNIVEVVEEVTSAARGILVRHPLRAADAVHLASALMAQSRLADGLDAFVAFDRQLLDAARREGLTVIGA